MLHTRSKGHPPSGSGDFKGVFFTIYGRGGHLCHVTKIFCINFGYLILRTLHMEFDYIWPTDIRDILL